MLNVLERGYHARRVGAGERDALTPERAAIDGSVFGLIAVRNHRIDLAVVDQHLIELPVGVNPIGSGGVVLEDPEAPPLEQGRVGSDFSRYPRKCRLAHGQSTPRPSPWILDRRYPHVHAMFVTGTGIENVDPAYRPLTVNMTSFRTRRDDPHK